MQGFNMGRYVPPEHEGTTSANKLAGKHALGSRGRKAGQGIITVRFEMPFAVWCTTCPKETIIGQGVRFNAEKKKIGNYFSTPIFSFRMKHIACGGTIEIQTDPKNTAYVVTEGGRKRDTGEDKVLEGDIELLSPEERERRRQDAFANLEVTIEHKETWKTDKHRVEELQLAKEKDWNDTYAANQRIRKAFRAERKVRELDQARTEALKDKMSLGLEIDGETEEDRLRAGLIEYGDDGDEAIRKARSGKLFMIKHAESTKPSSREKQASSSNSVTKLAQKQFHDEVSHNTRAALDPFLSSKPVSTKLSLTGIKRKREVLNDAINSTESPKTAITSERSLEDTEGPKGRQPKGMGLEAYYEDSD